MHTPDLGNAHPSGRGCRLDAHPLTSEPHPSGRGCRLDARGRALHGGDVAIPRQRPKDDTKSEYQTFLIISLVHKVRSNQTVACLFFCVRF